MEQRNKHGLKETCKGLRNGWTSEERKKIGLEILPIIEIQKAYGNVLDAVLIVKAWERKFASRFTVDQLIYAIGVYTDKRDDFPTPSNLISILEPEEPKITEAQFIAAQKWQERNKNWSQFTPEALLIKEYRKQNDYKREVFEIGCDKVKQLAGNTFKRIS